MYTSGSTGRPKGVGVTHGNVVRLAAAPTYARFGPGETLLLFAATSFDGSTLELWGALANGARLALMPPGPRSLSEVAAALERLGVTALFLTTGLFHQMVAEHLPALAGVPQLMTGGDVAAPPVVERVLAALPGADLLNLYGPTENTTVTTCHAMRGAAGRARGATVPIGRPIGGTRVYVLGADLEPVPAAIPGELYAGGDGIARGYLGRPGATAERFVPDPFGGTPGAGPAGGRLYRTGDRARWLEGGALEFLGRRDRQVKLRGHRVEPGEVEAALGRHPEVAACLVVVRNDAPGGDRRLVAYAVPRAAAPAPAELRAFLRERLPEPMVPGHVVLLDALPLDSNGKPDRRALPPPDWAGDGGDPAAGTAAAPRTPLEELVVGVWRQVLGTERIGLEESFFDLGGHSLLATQVVSRLEAACGARVPLGMLFDAPTPAGLAARLGALLQSAEAAAPAPIAPLPPDRPAPLSWAQERLWFLEQFDPGSSLLLMPLPLRLDGPLDVAALAAALTALVARHGALRATFGAADGRPFQTLAAPAPVPLPVVDLAALPAGARERAAERLLAGDARRPLDLERGPLYAARLFRLGGREHLLSWVFHHLVSDGWSVGVFLDELAVLYRAGAGPEPGTARLAPLPVGYADYAAWQRSPRSEALFAEQLEWWRERLAGAPAALDLPVDRPRPRRQTFRAGTLRWTLAAGPTAALDRFAASEGATPFMVLAAALAALLARLSGQSDVLIGSPVAGRSRPEIEGLIGLFLNTVVVRLDAGLAPGAARRPPSASWWRGRARRRSAPSPTRRCRSSACSPPSSPSATRPGRRSSR